MILSALSRQEFIALHPSLQDATSRWRMARSVYYANPTPKNRGKLEIAIDSLHYAEQRASREWEEMREGN